MARIGVVPVLLGSWILQFCVGDVEMPYYLSKTVEDEVKSDDNRQAVLKVRTRIAAGLNKSYGVMMVSTAQHMEFSVHTIPIWKAYCEKHGYDFFLQEESMVDSARDHWTNPRLLMELVTKSKWKYLWLVTPNSLPVNFEKGWTYAVKEHMRKQRYRNDNQRARVVWCPEDCDKEYNDGIMEGACHGPHVSGCIFYSQEPKKVMNIFRSWLNKRKDLEDDARSLKLGLDKTRTDTDPKLNKVVTDGAGSQITNYDRMVWADVSKEMGHDKSNFLRTFTYDPAGKGWNVRDQVLETLQKNKVLGDILNKNGQYRPEL